MVLPTSCIKNHCLNKHLLNGTNHAKDSKLPEVMAKLIMKYQASFSAPTKEHAWQPGNKATWLPCHINLLQLSLPMQMVMVTFCLICLQIAQHAICPEYNTILVWISYIKGDFTLPSPSSCSFRWATCGAFPLSFAASWRCTIIGWVLDCCLCESQCQLIKSL